MTHIIHQLATPSEVQTIHLHTSDFMDKLRHIPPVAEWDVLFIFYADGIRTLPWQFLPIHFSLFHVFLADKWHETVRSKQTYCESSGLCGSRPDVMRYGGNNADTTGCLESTGTWCCQQKYCFAFIKMVITLDQAGNSKQMSLISYPSLLQNQHGIHMKDS